MSGTYHLGYSTFTLKITGSNTACIVFLYENSAFVYEEHTKKQPVTFNGIVAKVAVVLIFGSPSARPTVH